MNKKAVDYSDELTTLKKIHTENMGRKFSDDEFNEIVQIAEQKVPGLFKRAVQLQNDLLGFLRALDTATAEWYKEGISKSKDEFRHHKLLAGYYEIQRKKLWDAIQNLKLGSGFQMRTAVAALEKELDKIQKKEDQYNRKSRELFNPKIHGKWNDSIPKENEVIEYGEANNAEKQKRLSIETDYVSSLNGQELFLVRKALLNKSSGKVIGIWEQATKLDIFSEDEKVKLFFDLLPVADAKNYQHEIPSTQDDLPRELQEKVFLLLLNGKIYFVDTQGYTYARYVLELENYKI